MAKHYRDANRDQVFLLPPDMRDWLGPDHLVWVLLEVIDQLDLSVFHARRRTGGVGRRGYDPAMLLALLIYGYASGQRSSRRIEALCTTDVAYRVICGNDIPDHTQIARFRKDNQEAFASVFTQVLVLCAQAGLGRFATIAIDGTKIAANASIGASRSYESLLKQVQAMTAEADDIDAVEDGEFGDARGDEIAGDFADPVTRKQRIKAALAQIETTRQVECTVHEVKIAGLQTKLEQAQERHQELRDARQALWDAGTHRSVAPDEYVRVREAAGTVSRREQQLARAQAEGVSDLLCKQLI